MATLIKLPDGTFVWEHIKDYYYSEKEKTQANTYILNSDRDIRIDIGSDQGAIIGHLPKGTLVVIDEEQVNTQWGWKRIIAVKDLLGYLPPEIRKKQEELEPVRYWKRAAWVDWSGLSVWPPPEPPAPPEPPTPPEQPVYYDEVLGFRIGKGLRIGIYKEIKSEDPVG